MSRRLLAGLVGAVILAAPHFALAQRAVSLSFAQLGLGTIPSRVPALAADRTNQVWVATDQGASGVQGDARAPFFPFRAGDGLLSNDVRALTFGQVGTDENFFLGFPNGIQHGRLISTSGLQLTGSLLAGPAQDSRNLVNALASDGARTVWAATAGGLVEWDISGQSPTLGTTFLPGAGALTRVAVAPWPGDRAAVASAGRELFLVRTTSNPATTSFFTAAAPVADIAFDPAGNLWALSERRDVIRFNAAIDRASGQGSFPTRSDFAIGVSPRATRALAVDPFTGTVWVGTDLGAYFQTPLEGTLGSRVCGGGDEPGVGCWALDTTANFTQAERVDRVFADPSGNTWFGTNRGLRGRIVRLLSLDSSTYLGGGAQAVISLEDLPGFAGNGRADTAAVAVAVGTASTTVEATEADDDSGRFTFTVALAEVADVPGSDGVEVRVEYAFLDPDQMERTLVARARWANIVSFEDDLWIGGLCFLEALRR